MLRRTKGSTFFLDDEADQINHESKKNHVSRSSSSSSSSNSSSSDSVGLRILIDDEYQSNSHQESNNNIVVVKPTFRLGGSSTTSTRTHRRIAAASSQEYSTLKACSLCKKKLNPQKDVYMYRGDQGFCSVDCRCRQMLIDEIREMEASTKEILASSRHSPTHVWVGGIPERRRGGIQAAA